MKAIRKSTAQAIVNIFETGRVRGDYGRVTLLEGDSGRLTYGRSQTTLASGNLYRLLNAYVHAPHARFGTRFEPYLASLRERSTALDHDATFRSLLEEAGDDPAMQRVQDAFFDKVYWSRAEAAARRQGFVEPLSVAVVYDSFIHGSWGRVRDLTDELVVSTGTPAGERLWIVVYVLTRRMWLSTRRNRLLHRTVYRMDAFLRLIRENRWNLDLPLEVRGCRINEETLGLRSSREALPGENDAA